MLGVDESNLRTKSSRFRSSDGGGSLLRSEVDAQSEVVKVVDLWSCYVKLHSNAEGHFTTFMLYAVYWVLLMMTFFDGPSSRLV